MARRAAVDAEELERLKKVMDDVEVDFRNAKIAYYNRTEYKGKIVAYEDFEQYAKAFIAANHAFQKAAYGKVVVKLTVARLARE